MKQSTSVRPALAGLLAIGAFAASVSGASASDAGIRAAIISYDGVLTSDEGRLLTTLGTYQQTGNSGPVRLAIAAEVKDLNGLKAKVAAQPATSPRVKAGKAKFLSGVAKIVKAYRKLSTALGEKTANPQAAKAEVKKADAIVKQGRAQLRAALRLLG